MKMNIAGLLIVTLLPVLLAAACGGTDATPKMKSYDNDGYLGITNTNPNLQTGPSYHTYAVDTEMMRSAVAQIAGVQSVRIATNGAKANVKIFVNPGLSAQEIARIRDESLRALQQAVPRYTYDVETEVK